MAKKKVSDTLAQQKKARESFLELKKIQSGEIEPAPKPSEEAISPQTLTEKISNFWFHFKWHVIATVFFTVGLSVLITQCASRPKYDMQVIYFTYTPVIDEQTALIADYFETLCPDINGDGKVEVGVLNCSMKPNTANQQYNHDSLSKLQAYIAGEDDALLYITDDESIKYFDKDGFGDFFDTKPLELSDEFYDASKSPNFGVLPENLSISCRRIDNTIIGTSSKAAKVYKASIEILGKLEKTK